MDDDQSNRNMKTWKQIVLNIVGALLFAALVMLVAAYLDVNAI